MTRDNTTRRRFLTISGAAVVGGFGATGTASADTDTAGVLGDGFAPEADIRAFVSGFVARYGGNYGPPTDVETLADRLRNEFTANEDLWLSYGNWLLDEQDADATGDTTVGVDIALTRSRWPLTDQRTATTIEVTTADNRFESVAWRAGAPGDPDFEVTVANTAAENAADELQAFRREWIGTDEADHELPSDEYLNELAGQYWDGITLGAAERSALEVLLGEVDV